MWDSEGRFSVRNSIDDIRAAIRYLEGQPIRPIAVAGYSYSGHGALTVSAEEPEVSCLVSIDAADLAIRGRELAEDEEFLISYRNYGVTQIGPDRPFHTIDIDAFIEEHIDLPESDALIHLSEHLVSKRLLLISSDLEEYSPNRIPHYAPLAEALEMAGPVSLRKEFVDANHDFTGKHAQVRNIVTEWLNEDCRVAE